MSIVSGRWACRKYNWAKKNKATACMSTERGWPARQTCGVMHMYMMTACMMQDGQVRPAISSSTGEFDSLTAAIVSTSTCNAL